MNDLATRRHTKRQVDTYNAILEELSQLIKADDSLFWTMVHHCLTDYAKITHKAWVSVVRQKTEVNAKDITFSIRSAVTRQIPHPDIVTYKLENLAIPCIVPSAGWGKVEELKEAILKKHGKVSHSMTLFWWAAIKWMQDNQWEPIIVANHLDEPGVAFLSPSRLQLITISCNYKNVVIDAEYIDKIASGREG